MSARESAQRARTASRKLQALPTEERVAMLQRVADALVANEAAIMAENAKVCACAGRMMRLLTVCAQQQCGLAGAVVGTQHACQLMADGGWPTVSKRAASVRGASWPLVVPQRDPITPPPLAPSIQDVAEAEGKVSPALLQRLVLKPQKISQLAEGIRAIAAQEEPIRRVLQRCEVAQGA
jgi:gamma-glutamyl phosphate reductase